MPGVLVQCPKHGIVENAGVITVSGSGSLFMGDSISMECPICGTMSSVVSGRYQQGPSGGMQATLLPTPEQARLLQEGFRQITRVATSKKLTDEEARERIDQMLDELRVTNPNVVAEFEKTTAGKPRKVWSASAKAITAALAAVGAYNTIADFSDRVAGLVQYFLDH